MSSRLRIAVIALGCAAAVGAGAVAASTTMSRVKLRGAEVTGDSRFQTMLNDDPSALLGPTRAVYLPGYGMVFSAEIDLAPRFTPNPFRPSFSKEEIARIRELKQHRLVTVRDGMRNLMVTWAANIDIPANENVALSVTIPYSKVEDSEGLPRQIVMSADRATLRSGNAGAINSAFRVQEYF